MKLFRGTSWQEIELRERGRFVDYRKNDEPMRFKDVADASAFLRSASTDPFIMAELRRVFARADASVDHGLLSDAEVIDGLAPRLAGGSIEVVAKAVSKNLAQHIPEEVEEKKPEPPKKEDADVEFEITDHFDDPMTDLEWVLVYPDGKTKKSGKLGKDGTVKESGVPPGQYKLLFKIVSGASWVDQQLEVDKETKLQASAGGFDPGTPGKFEVFPIRGLEGKPLATVDGKVNDKKILEASWTPSKSAVKDVTSGELVFRAKINNSSAVSPPARILQKHGFELSDDDGPLADTPFVAFFSDGKTLKGDVKGGKVELLVPLGRKLIWIDLPEHPGAHVEVSYGDGGSHAYVLWESSDETWASGGSEEGEGQGDEVGLADDSGDGDADDDDDDDVDADADADAGGDDAGEGATA